MLENLRFLFSFTENQREQAVPSLASIGINFDKIRCRLGCERSVLHGSGDSVLLELEVVGNLQQLAHCISIKICLCSKYKLFRLRKIGYYYQAKSHCISVSPVRLEIVCYDLSIRSLKIGYSNIARLGYIVIVIIRPDLDQKSL